MNELCVIRARTVDAALNLDQFDTRHRSDGTMKKRSREGASNTLRLLLTTVFQGDAMSDRESSGFVKPAQPLSQVSTAFLAEIEGAACQKFGCSRGNVSPTLFRAFMAEISVDDLRRSVDESSTLSEWIDLVDAWVGVEETRWLA